MKNTKNNHNIGQLKQFDLNLQQLTSFSYLKIQHCKLVQINNFQSLKNIFFRKRY